MKGRSDPVLTVKKKLKDIYGLLEAQFGDPGWWPADDPFEVIVGAVLTQNTSWSNVEKAILELKKRSLLSPGAICEAGLESLAKAIRPSGYYRIKAGRLKEISSFLLRECGGKLRKLKKNPSGELREKLLSVKGVGPETADSILLYAFEYPVFVVDAYTKRVFSRHDLVSEKDSYDHVQALVHDNFPEDVVALNRFHAYIVELGKAFCKKRDPLCGSCPLKGL